MTNVSIAGNRCSRSARNPNVYKYMYELYSYTDANDDNDIGGIHMPNRKNNKQKNTTRRS